MFFIMGINQKESKLRFHQLVICKCCETYGHVEVFMTYTYVMLFFIPVFRWNKRYYLRMSCCNSTIEIDKALGRAIEHGEIQEINFDQLHFEAHQKRTKSCANCGYSNTDSDYIFCPRCGNRLS